MMMLAWVLGGGRLGGLSLGRGGGVTALLHEPLWCQVAGAATRRVKEERIVRRIVLNGGNGEESN